MEIVIEETQVQEKTGTGANGRPYHIRDQQGYAILPGKAYPIAVRIPLEREQPPYPLGRYHLADESFMVGQFDTLKLGRLVLEAE